MGTPPPKGEYSTEGFHFPWCPQSWLRSSGVWDVWAVAYDLFVRETNENRTFWSYYVVKILTSLGSDLGLFCVLFFSFFATRSPS